MTVKKIILLLFVVLLLCIGSVSATSEIHAPGGSLASGTPAWFPVTAGGLQNVTSMQVILEWNPQYVVVDDIAVNNSIPGLAIVAGPSGPLPSVTYADNKEGHAIINLNVSMLNQTEVLPVIRLLVHPTNPAGTSPFNVAGFVSTNVQPNRPFNTLFNSTIVTNGAGSLPMGQLLYPSGTIVRGSSATLPLYVGYISGMNFSVAFMNMNPAVINISAITLNSSVSESPIFSTNHDFSGRSWYADVSKGSGITRGILEGYLDVTFNTNASGTADQVIFSSQSCALYTLMPSNGFRVTYPFASTSDGIITINGGTPTPPADASHIWFPAGALVAGGQGAFPFTISNLSAATSVNIWSSFNPRYVVIDNITVNSSFPGITIGGETRVNNAGQGPETDMGMLGITLNAPAGFGISSPTKLIYLHTRAAEQAGNISPFSGSAMYNLSTFFDFTHEGFISSAGGGNPATHGKIIAPSGSVPEGSEATFPVMVKNLTRVDNFTFWLIMTDRETATITHVALSPGISGNITMHPMPEFAQYSFYVTCQPGLNVSETPMPLVDVTFRANATEGRQTGIIFNTTDFSPRPTWQRFPGFPVIYPFNNSQPGTITIGSAGPRPLPHFFANQTTGFAPLPVLFNSSTSDALADIPLTYLWNFGDDTTQSTAPNPVHTYARSGTFSVSLAIINASGTGSVTRADYITVTAAPPTTIIAPNGTVAGRQQVTLPVLVANLTGVHGIGFSLMYDPLLLHVDDVVMSPEFSEASSKYFDADHPAGVLRVAIYRTRVSDLTPLLNISAGSPPVPLADITFTANSTAGISGLGFIPYTEWSENPILDNTSHIFEIQSSQNIIVTPELKPDLVGRIVDQPGIIKKYHDYGHLRFNATFAIDNIGTGPTTGPFDIKVQSGEYNQSLTINPQDALGHFVPIIPGGTYIVRTINNVSWMDFFKTDESGFYRPDHEDHYVNANQSVSVGNHTIGIQIDVTNAVDEADETNNYVSTTFEVAQPDLIPVFDMKLVTASGQTTIVGDVIPGTYKITYGAKNIGRVFSVNTTLLYSMYDGTFHNQTFNAIPQLGAAGQGDDTWVRSETVVITPATKSFSVEVNTNRSQEAEYNATRDPYANNGYSTSFQSFKPVTLVLPTVTGSTSSSTAININLTNVTTRVMYIDVPFRYDPSICYVESVSIADPTKVYYTSVYGRLMFMGRDMTIDGDTRIATVNLRTWSEEGRSSVLTSDTGAKIQTTGSNPIDFEIQKGAFQQPLVTDARVSLWTYPQGNMGTNQSLYLSLYNYHSNSVTVSMNLTANGVPLQTWDNIVLGPWESRYYPVNTWQPASAGTYQIEASIMGDTNPEGNISTSTVYIRPYTVNITDANKDYWERYVGYNKSLVRPYWFSLGTYFTANQSGLVNATLVIWDKGGTRLDLTDKSVFELIYCTPSYQPYAYESGWNYAGWYYLSPKKLGVYKYSIELESRSSSTHVNGTITVTEPFVDVKVRNSTEKADTELVKTLYWNLTADPDATDKQVTIQVSAGSEGRALQGLGYLTWYPNGCPEQTMSPTLASLRILQYYEAKGDLTSAMRDTYMNQIRGGVQRMSAPLGSMSNPDGYNAQQLSQYARPISFGDGSGGWAWWRDNSPSMFYTMYPNYVLTEVYQSNTSYWKDYIKPEYIDFNQSVNWLINRQNTGDGAWHEWGYIYDPYIWTGWCELTFDHQYDYLSDTMKNRVNQSMERAYTYLNDTPSSASNDAKAYAVMGLVGIKNRIGNATLNAAIDAKVADLTGQLLTAQHYDPVSGTTYWDGGGYWYVNYHYTTAQVLKALYAGGVDEGKSNATIRHGLAFFNTFYDSGGRWWNTATTGAVIEAIAQLQPGSKINGTADITVKDALGVPFKTITGVRFNNTPEGSSHTWDLTPSELDALYIGGSGQPQVIADNWVNGTDDSHTRLIMSVSSRSKLPQSVAYSLANDGLLPWSSIDPIATDFTISVSVPPHISQYESGNVSFTLTNLNLTADQTMMTVEVPVNTEGVTFEGSAVGSDKAFYRVGNEPHYLTHQYNATGNYVVFFPGSDDANQTSVLAGQSKTFYLPLKFSNAGNVTVQARAYPMYNDEWMQLGNTSGYISGYGNLTLAVVDGNNAPTTASFYVDGILKNSNTNTTTNSTLEGTHTVVILKGATNLTSTVSIVLGQTTSYTTQIATDTSVPHILSAEGDVANIRVLPPTIYDTTNPNGTVYWSAARNATKTFNSTLASSGGYATLAVDLPNVSRSFWNSTAGNWTGTVRINEITNVQVYNGTNWIPFTGYTIANNQLIMDEVDTSVIRGVNISFTGMKWGDVNRDGNINIFDSYLCVRYGWGKTAFTDNQVFYADVNNDGKINIFDSYLMVRRGWGKVDPFYQAT